MQRPELKGCAVTDGAATAGFGVLRLNLGASDFSAKGKLDVYPLSNAVSQMLVLNSIQLRRPVWRHYLGIVFA